MSLAKSIFIVGILFCIASCETNSEQSEQLMLKYNESAEPWTEALPIGNGRQGAMIYGDPLNEHFQLNENTLYSGEPTTYKNTDIRPTYDKVMQLLKEDKYAEAEKIMAKNWLGRLHQYYQPFGDLKMNFDGDVVTNYQRTLDISKAVSTVSYTTSGISFKREIFASFPDQVIAVKITADKKSSISFETFMESVHPNCNTTINGNTITFAGQVPGFIYRRTLENAEKNGDQHKYPELFNEDGSRKSFAKQVLYGDEVDGKGMFFEGRLEIRNSGGKISKTENGVSISNADEVVILLSMATSYNGFDKSPSSEGLDPAALNKQILSKLSSVSYDELKENHTADYAKLFNRVDFNLESAVNNNDKPTNVRLKEYALNPDPALNVLLFQYGRYLLISGSREGGQPLNLQGIWNNKVMPPWNSAYTMNINAEMNYWPVEATNLSECHQPFFKMVKELAITGKETAKNMYGNPGWVAHHNTDIWRPTYPADNDVSYSYWPVGAGWLTSHLWEHYLFTGDTKFLKDEAYPLLKGCAEFFASWLIENNDGYLVTPVGTSPENLFRYGEDKSSSVSSGCTMDMAIVRENFERVIKASELLDVDLEFRKELQSMQSKLLPHQIGERGQLQEWQQDFIETDVHHRHLSHLYGFHPGDQITKDKTPELFEAVRKTLELRGDEATGWSMGWKINFWARMQDGNHAFKIINNLFTFVDEKMDDKHGGLYANLFDAHPPFQIDGNFGYTAGVAEMLLQSHAGEIHLLPALPDAWATGSIKGLKARGNIEVSISWEDGELLEFSLKSKNDQTVKVRLNDQMKEIELKARQEMVFGGSFV
jgi:alpha-L-fucosidase 2